MLLECGQWRSQASRIANPCRPMTPLRRLKSPNLRHGDMTCNCAVFCEQSAFADSTCTASPARTPMCQEPGHGNLVLSHSVCPPVVFSTRWRWQGCHATGNVSVESEIFSSDRAPFPLVLNNHPDVQLRGPSRPWQCEPLLPVTDGNGLTST